MINKKELFAMLALMTLVFIIFSGSSKASESEIQSANQTIESAQNTQAVQYAEVEKTRINADAERASAQTKNKKDKVKADSISQTGQTKKTPPKEISKPTTPPEKVSSAKIEWFPYDKGLALAKKTSKFMFIDYTATWCGWCKKMEAETFSKPEVIEMLNTYFVPIKIWSDKDNPLDIEGYKITEKNYANGKGITGYPTFDFEAPTREMLTRFSGYRDAATLMKYLTQVKSYLDTATTGPGKTPKTGK
jgi:thioredoxin-related protein